MGTLIYLIELKGKICHRMGAAIYTVKYKMSENKINQLFVGLVSIFYFLIACPL
jgi:hypothetical protein